MNNFRKSGIFHSNFPTWSLRNYQNILRISEKFLQLKKKNMYFQSEGLILILLDCFLCPRRVAGVMMVTVNKT